MVCDNRVQINRREHIAIKDDGRGVDLVFRVLECAPGSQRIGLNGVPNTDSVFGAVLQEVLDLTRLIRKAEDDLLDPAASHEIDLVQQEWRVGYRDYRLRSIDRQRPEAGSFATGKDESLHTTLLIPETRPHANASGSLCYFGTEEKLTTRSPRTSVEFFLRPK
jgi:hypothetical protein